MRVGGTSDSAWPGVCGFVNLRGHIQAMGSGEHGLFFPETRLSGRQSSHKMVSPFLSSTPVPGGALLAWSPEDQRALLGL